jgi:hypothetical protein
VEARDWGGGRAGGKAEADARRGTQSGGGTRGGAGCRGRAQARGGEGARPSGRRTHGRTRGFERKKDVSSLILS